MIFSLKMCVLKLAYSAPCFARISTIIIHSCTLCTHKALQLFHTGDKLSKLEANKITIKCAVRNKTFK